MFMVDSSRFNTGGPKNYKVVIMTDMDLGDLYAYSGTSHERIACDVCGVCPIRGTRWMCRDCPNYDMCSTCYENKRYMHDMSHSFIKMIHQTKVLAHVEGSRASSLQALPTKRDRSTNNDSGTSHERIACDVCGGCPIRGTRWMCRDCLAYDMCSTCYENKRYMHDMSHSFRKMIHQTKVLAHVERSRASSLQALPKRDRSTNNDSGTSHEGIGCDVCGVCPIRGTRWMCRDCLAYDMCSTCYENKRYMHDMSHSFIKMIHQTKVLKKQKETHEVPETPSFLPSDWTKMKPDEHVKKVNLATSSEEFMNVMGKFIETIDKKIISIRRVQNKFLWEVYFLKRKQMEGMNGKIGANEKNLFHGTKPDIIQSVCVHNLDMRLAGTNVGAILGNGTYFALEARMSDSYATPDPKTGHKYVLQCRVLVGHCTKGQQGLRRPPEMARTPDSVVRLYDSCVDNVCNPSIFCIFDHVQYYPEYIIEYK